MTQNIHPSAWISPDAKIGKNVKIGAFAVIENNVEIGVNSTIQAHAVIQSFTKMGSGNVIHPHVVLGDLPQDIHFNPETITWLEIGDNNTFREGFTAHRATVENSATHIGSDCYFMNNSHVAHDCSVGNKTILPITSLLAVMLKSEIMFLWAVQWLYINFAVSAHLRLFKAQQA